MIIGDVFFCLFVSVRFGLLLYSGRNAFLMFISFPRRCKYRVVKASNAYWELITYFSIIFFYLFFFSFCIYWQSHNMCLCRIVGNFVQLAGGRIRLFLEIYQVAIVTCHGLKQWNTFWGSTQCCPEYLSILLATISLQLIYLFTFLGDWDFHCMMNQTAKRHMCELFYGEYLRIIIEFIIWTRKFLHYDWLRANQFIVSF